MTKILIGTAGWDYKDWSGSFYPKNLEKAEHLAYYAKFFDITEINSTFYNLPSEEMVKNWFNVVSKEFKFVVKVWQNITHKFKDADNEYYISEFFSRLEALSERIIAFLFQFPPWFKRTENHLKYLKNLIEQIPPTYSYVIELRDNSWFEPSQLSQFIDGKHIVLGTTYMPGIDPFYLPNQKRYYIRLIGDRALTKFDKIQRTQSVELEAFEKSIQKLLEIKNIDDVFVIVNNHFMGFAPDSVNLIKKMLSLSFRNFSQQRSLSDFL